MKTLPQAVVMVFWASGLAHASDNEGAAGPFAAYAKPLEPTSIAADRIALGPSPFVLGQGVWPGHGIRATALPVCTIRVLRPQEGSDPSMVKDLPMDVDPGFTRKAACASPR